MAHDALLPHPWGRGGETVATDSFKFWDSYRDALKRCTPEQGYRLIMALCGAVFDGEEADFSDEPLLGMVYDVMLEQAIQSRDIARQARAAAKRPRPSRRKKKASDTLAHASETPSVPSSEEKRSEAKGNEASHSLRECSGAAYAGSGSRPPATPAPDPWDDPDYDGPIPYLGPDDSDGTDLS